MKRLLMIVFHFPPLAISSGIQRTLSFARHLPNFGWEPLVLTAHPRAYERVSDDQLGDLPAGSIVERAFALDAAKHLAVGGRHLAITARPDRWVAWWLGAVPRGLAMIRKYRPAALWSTYPIATAHKIGHTLQCVSGLPWIADFRDPMAQEGYPADPRTWRSFRHIEEGAVRRSRCCVFVTPGAARMYRRRYADLPASRIAVIENGYDEEIFATLDGVPQDDGPLVPGSFTLVHSGIVYPSERDPTYLFRALRRMLDDGGLKPRELRLRLRASAHEALLNELIERFRLSDVVELAPPISYRSALREMLRADGLVVLQASNCNDQIPAKVYEYLRSERPIVALTDPAGETAALLRRAGIDAIARLDSQDEICRVVRQFLDQAAQGQARAPDRTFGRIGSRLARTREFVTVLDQCIAAGPHKLL
jgi:glycosyltransferase involved in cell wall biosynthesis